VVDVVGAISVVEVCSVEEEAWSSLDTAAGRLDDRGDELTERAPLSAVVWVDVVDDTALAEALAWAKRAASAAASARSAAVFTEGAG